MTKMFTRIRIILVLTFFLFLNLHSSAQIHNALSFDGTDDKVTVPNASALIANSNQISLTVWAYPDSFNVGFPDFNGFAGFRNDLSADFYLVHIYMGQLEGRFTNSSGTSSTLLINGVQPQVWQHFALTYDGSYLRIYANGYIADSIASSGTITSNTQPFNIGFLPFGATPFYTQGKVDEPTLWNKVLTQEEIQCIMQYGADLADPDLKLSFNCNQGIPGGNNSGITALKDQSNHINGVFGSMPLTGGNISNFVTGQFFGHTSFDETLCQGETYFFNGQNLGTAGVYTATFPGDNGCDSIVVLNLNFTTLNLNVLQNGTLFASLETAATYQWVNCTNNFAIIPNAINQTYTATTSGSYAVILTKANCVDTTACFPVTISVAENINELPLQIFPNPATNNLNISFERNMENIMVAVYTLEGKWLFEKQFLNQKECKIELKDMINGTYLLRVNTDKGNAIKIFQKTE